MGSLCILYFSIHFESDEIPAQARRIGVGPSITIRLSTNQPLFRTVHVPLHKDRFLL